MSAALTGLLHVTAEAVRNSDAPVTPDEAHELLMAVRATDRELLALAERIKAKHDTERATSKAKHPTVPTFGTRAGFDPAGSGDDEPDDPPDDKSLADVPDPPPTSAASGDRPSLPPAAGTDGTDKGVDR